MLFTAPVCLLFTTNDCLMDRSHALDKVRGGAGRQPIIKQMRHNQLMRQKNFTKSLAVGLAEFNYKEALSVFVFIFMSPTCLCKSLITGKCADWSKPPVALWLVRFYSKISAKCRNFTEKNLTMWWIPEGANYIQSLSHTHTHMHCTCLWKEDEVTVYFNSLAAKITEYTVGN